MYNDEAIDACVKLSDRYMTDRLLPDKAIDVLDENELLEVMNVTPTESEAGDIVQMEEIERELLL